MGRTRYGRRGVGGPLNVNTQLGQYYRCKEIAGKKNRENFKIKFLLPLRDWKTIIAKNSKNGERRQMTVRRRTKYLAKEKRRTY